MTIEEAAQAVIKEYHRACRLYPDWPTDPIHAASILAEESGETLKEANNFYWGHKDHLAALKKSEIEAVQSGAMALRYLVGMDRYRARQDRRKWRVWDWICGRGA